VLNQLRTHARKLRVPVSVAIVLLSGAVQADPTLVGSTTDATGIDNLVVDLPTGQETFDVAFRVGPYDSAFSNPAAFLNDPTGAVSAVFALQSALNGLDVTQLGPLSSTGARTDVLFLPFAVGSDGSVFGERLGNSSCCGTPGWGVTLAGPLGSTELGPPIANVTDPLGCIEHDAGGCTGIAEYAVFSPVGSTGPTAVPEPATLALFGLGLAGVWLSRRRRSLTAAPSAAVPCAGAEV
jgi:hypothetical protein